jgi:hypothetical protein
MALAKNTGSTLSYDSGKNKTSTAISTNIIITVPTSSGFIPVGAVKSLKIDEKRSIKMIDEVGTDGHVDSVPTSSTNISGSCERVRFDRLRVAEAFARGFVHVSAQAYPFDIVIFDNQKDDGSNQISTVIQNVWIEGISYSYSADDWIISDSMSWVAETIYSIMNVGGGSVANGGERGDLQGYIQQADQGKSTWIERQTDRGDGGRRGSLDAAGLISLGSSGTLF